jgi:hypothetical protein
MYYHNVTHVRVLDHSRRLIQTDKHITFVPMRATRQRKFLPQQSAEKIIPSIATWQKMSARKILGKIHIDRIFAIDKKLVVFE